MVDILSCSSVSRFSGVQRRRLVGSYGDSRGVSAKVPGQAPTVTLPAVLVWLAQPRFTQRAMIVNAELDKTHTVTHFIVIIPDTIK